MYAGWPVPFLYGQAMQHFESCQVAVAPDSVAEHDYKKNSSQETYPAEQLFQAGQHGLGVYFIIELYD